MKKIFLMIGSLGAFSFPAKAQTNSKEQLKALEIAAESQKKKDALKAASEAPRVLQLGDSVILSDFIEELKTGFGINVLLPGMNSISHGTQDGSGVGFSPVEQQN
jgi:hypothetical protein